MRSLALVVALAALAVGCGGEAETSAPSSAPPEAAAPPAAERPQAPPVEGTTLDGARISLAGFRGRPVLVNVWSSW